MSPQGEEADKEGKATGSEGRRAFIIGVVLGGVRTAGAISPTTLVIQPGARRRDEKGRR